MNMHFNLFQEVLASNQFSLLVQVATSQLLVFPERALLSSGQRLDPKVAAGLRSRDREHRTSQELRSD